MAQEPMTEEDVDRFCEWIRTMKTAELGALWRWVMALYKRKLNEEYQEVNESLKRKIMPP